MGSASPGFKPRHAYQRRSQMERSQCSSLSAGFSEPACVWSLWCAVHVLPTALRWSRSNSLVASIACDGAFHHRGDSSFRLQPHGMSLRGEAAAYARASSALSLSSVEAVVARGEIAGRNRETGSIVKVQPVCWVSVGGCHSSGSRACSCVELGAVLQRNISFTIGEFRGDEEVSGRWPVGGGCGVANRIPDVPAMWPCCAFCWMDGA